MISLWSLAVAVLLLQLFNPSHGRRLLLGDDGFARVDGTPAEPASGITVSSWVNITQFPGGVAPIVTMISEDASYQIAFFIRHDGAGVLWGGPASQQLLNDDFVDRHPRTRFGKERKRRNAVDYSMGLGDVMNIMSPRKERSNTWTPMNFVDVSEMGVADLETSGSNTNNHYENWYDVGYELQMQESAHPEPKILTKPSGENDFVVINWDGQNIPPLSTNQWDPVNGDLETSEYTSDPVATRIRAPENEQFVWSQEDSRRDGGWTSQVIPFSGALPNPINANRKENIPATATPKTTKQRTRKRPSRPFVPDLTRRPSSSENIKTVRPAPDNFRYNTRRRRPSTSTTTTATTTTTTSTTTRRPVHISQEVVQKSQESRVPLWARLKKTSSEEKKILAKEESITTTTTVPLTTRAPSPQQTTTTTTQRTIPRVRATTIRQRVSAHKITTPAPKITTRLPVTSTRRPQQTTNKPIVNKFKHHTKNSSERKIYNNRKTYNNQNGKIPQTKSHNRNQRPLTSHSLDEFKRLVEGKSAVKDVGNKIVVYSMPITDVDAYNRMYEQYQESESRHNPRINLQAVYDKASEGKIAPTLNEDEANQNYLEQVPEPLPILTYKEEPLHYAEQTSIPITTEKNELTTEKDDNTALPLYDAASFRPIRIEDHFGTLEKDYSAYYPYVQKVEPVHVTTLVDQEAQSAEGPYTVRLPLADLVGALPVMRQRPNLYRIAVPAQQDISGQQAGFYQEPSRISHEQLPPQYTQKPQTENKRELVNENRKRRPYVSSQEIRHNQHSSQNNRVQKPSSNELLHPLRTSVKNNQEKLHSTQDPINMGMTPPDLPQPFHNAEQVRLAEEIIKQNYKPQDSSVKITEDNNIPIEIRSDLLEIETTPEIIKDVPLDVNFRKMPYKFDSNTWYHISFTWNSFDHVLRIYINGQLAGILEGTIPDLKLLPTSGMMLLGKTLLPSLTGFDPTSHLTGEMSNFVVWGESLTPQEVNNVFTCGPAPLHPVLLAWNTTPLRVYNDATVKQAPPICGISS